MSWLNIIFLIWQIIAIIAVIHVIMDNRLRVLSLLWYQYAQGTLDQ